MRTALCSLTFFLLACSPDSTDKSGLQSLADAFEAANRAESVEPMLALYHLEGSDDTSREMLHFVIRNELGLEIEEIRFEPLRGTPEENIAYEHEGKQYGATLEPKMRMRVRYATEDRFESLFSVGQLEDGTWRIAAARPLEQPSDRSSL